MNKLFTLILILLMTSNCTHNVYYDIENIKANENLGNKKFINIYYELDDETHCDINKFGKKDCKGIKKNTEPLSEPIRQAFKDYKFRPRFNITSQEKSDLSIYIQSQKVNRTDAIIQNMFGIISFGIIPIRENYKYTIYIKSKNKDITKTFKETTLLGWLLFPFDKQYREDDINLHINNTTKKILKELNEKNEI